MADDNVLIEITGREARLILDYGYPMPPQSDLFAPLSGKPGWHTVEIDKFWLDMIISDLGRSIGETRSRKLQEELYELCTTLEIKLQRY